MSNSAATLTDFLNRKRKFFLIWTLIAIVFRIFFFFKYRVVTDDSLIYADIAKNWLQHGVYGQIYDHVPSPTYIRMPGYPLFIVLVWLIAGIEHYNAILIAQVAIDIVTCLIVADLARRIASERAAQVAFILTALCPFFANYAAVPLTETLSIFFAAVALDLLVTALDAPKRQLPWINAGIAAGLGILLRPDGGILLAAVGLYALLVVVRKRSREVALGSALTVIVALAMLVPWTIRNWRAFRQFQPLTPFNANMPWEFVPHGFQRWCRTWIADYSSLEDVWFKVDGTEVTVGDLPPRAFDDEQQRKKTDELFHAYVENGNAVSPAVDTGFNELAEERIRKRPVRYYVTLPLMRAADLWLRPRTEMLPVDPHWWRLSEDDPPQFWTAAFLGFVNFVYLVTAAIALMRGRARYAGLFLLFAFVRTAFLAWMPNPEPRYVLECYPAVLAIAASLFGYSK